MEERVQKILAGAGVASRRKCEELIVQGRVLVNGKVVSLGAKADVSLDRIVVDGKQVVLEKKVYILLNKPKGVVTTVAEKFGMRTIMDIVKVPERAFPVGRLDKDTEGLLLLTNDGDFANRLTHPSFEVVKEYFVVLDKSVSDEIVESLKRGVVVDGRKVSVRGLKASGKEVVLSIHEGRKHIVRRLFEKLGRRVVRLMRTKIDFLGLGDLKPGKWRFLNESEVKKLINSRPGRAPS